jgi:hypothetical protein
MIIGFYDNQRWKASSILHRNYPSSIHALRMA